MDLVESADSAGNPLRSLALAVSRKSNFMNLETCIREVFFLIFILIFNINPREGQDRLFGKCNEEIHNYICSQMLIASDSSFEFMEYLHLDKKRITKGKYQLRGDTIILRSNYQPKVSYEKSTLNAKEVRIEISDEYGELPFMSICFTNDTICYETDEKGILEVESPQLESFYLIANYPGVRLSGWIKIPSKDIELISKMKIKFSYDRYPKNSSKFFLEEEWILKEGRLIYPNDEYKLDEKSSLEEVSLNNKRF